MGVECQLSDLKNMHVSTVDSLSITVSPKVVGPTQGNNPYNSRNALAHIQRDWAMMGVMS